MGLEALARLDHPLHGTLGPGFFVPPMENAGLSWPLTQAVMRRAFADWGEGRLEALDLTLALNLPLDVLLYPEALVRLDSERREAGIPAARVVIELTESRPISHLRELTGVTERLRAIGYGLAIDDVGPEIRDHSALMDLPFTMMKLDKRVVQDSLVCPDAWHFLDRAVLSARRAGMAVVAEGVEDSRTWEAMKDAGVELAQGFLFSRPMEARDVAEWCGAWV